jgi:hypothetical protein
MSDPMIRTLHLDAEERWSVVGWLVGENLGASALASRIQGSQI